MAATAPPPVKPKAALPTIKLGKPCLWRPSPDSEPSAALVTRAGAVISCVVFAPDLARPVTRDAVRHVSDPEFRRLGDQTSGVWDFVED